MTARQAAERYGLNVNRSGMACCPFHTARLLGLTSKDAALRLAVDFGIEISESKPRKT